MSSCSIAFPHSLLIPLFLKSIPDFLLEHDLSLVPPSPKPVCRVPSIHLYSPSRKPSAHLSSRTNEVILTGGLGVLYICTSLHHLASPPTHLQSPGAFHCSPKPSCRFPVFPQRYSYPFTLFFYSAAHSSVSKKSHQT